MSKLSPQDIGIILTYRCHSRCAHCLYNCGPQWSKEAMPPDTLRQALETVAAWSQPPQVHLTGGEPFLHFELLLAGTQMATELGIVCYLETNASWCTDEDEAIERFAALQRAGLQAVLISCSPFHAERIPPDRTIRAIRAALAVFGPTRTIIYQSEYLDIIQHFGFDHPTPLSRYEEEFGTEGARRILWDGYGIIPGGRAGYQLGHLTKKLPTTAFAATNCAQEILYAHHSHLDLYGNYISGFCGGLTVGSWRELSRILDDFQTGRYPPLIEALVEGGPYRLFEWAKEEFGYTPLSEGYAGKCHLCVDVRLYLVKHGEFAELGPKEFYKHI